MTDRADVIRMAVAANLGRHIPEGDGMCGMWIGNDLTSLTIFAELAKAAEREKWAKVAEQSVNCLYLAVAMRANKVWP